MEKKNILTKSWVVALLAAFCCMLWGSAIPMIKVGYQLLKIESSDIASQIVFAGIRFTIAGIMVILFTGVRERKMSIPDRETIKLAFFLCLAQTVGQYFFFYVGVANTSGVKGGIITGLGSFLTIILSCLIFRREPMTANKMMGCILGVIGVVMVNLLGNELDTNFKLIGEGFVFFASCSYAISSVLINQFSKKKSAVVLSGYQFFFGGLILTAIGFAMGGTFKEMSVAATMVLVYLAMVSAVAYTIWSVLLSHNPISKVTIYGFINPLCSVILSALLLGETKQAFNLGTLTALVLVCAGIYVVNRPQKK